MKENKCEVCEDTRIEFRATLTNLDGEVIDSVYFCFKCAQEAGHWSIAPRAQDAETLLQERIMKALHNYLHYNGKLKHILSECQHDAIFEMADGYGQMSIAQLRSTRLTWDWSHVRDSSREAKMRMYGELRRVLQVLGRDLVED